MPYASFTPIYAILPGIGGPPIFARHGYLEEPQLDVLATIVIDCVGDCILPRLTCDKKGNPDVEEFPAQNKDKTTLFGTKND